MAQQLEDSPMDKRKAIYGEKNQADYLVLAKEQSTDKKHRALFNDKEINEEIPASP